MSFAESPAQTINKFANSSGWKTASDAELAQDFLSISNETNLKWDQYVYIEKDGRLFDPFRNRFVNGSANGDEVEEGIISQVEGWFIHNDSGIAVWISPRSSERRYPEEKLAIHRIAYDLAGKKVLLCASHQFSTFFRNPEEIRKFIFTEDDSEESVLKIISWLKKASQKEVSSNGQGIEDRKVQANYYVSLYRSGLPLKQIIYDMTQTGFLGKNPIGCGSAASTTDNPSSYFGSQVFFPYTNSEDEYGSLSFTCPNCGATNTRMPGKLISNCQHCGGDVKC